MLDRRARDIDWLLDVNAGVVDPALPRRASAQEDHFAYRANLPPPLVMATGRTAPAGLQLGLTFLGAPLD